MNKEALDRIGKGWWWRRGGTLFRWVEGKGAGRRGKTSCEGLVVDFYGQKNIEASYFWDGLRFEEGAHLYEMARRGDPAFARLPTWETLKPSPQYQLGEWARVRAREARREYDVWTFHPHGPVPLTPRAGWAVFDRIEWNLADSTNAQLTKNFLEWINHECAEKGIKRRKGNEGNANNSLSWPAIEQLDMGRQGAKDGEHGYVAKAAREAEAKAKAEAAYLQSALRINGDAAGLALRLFGVKVRGI